MKNGKQQGELAQIIVIATLARMGIRCAIPLGDNIPIDLVLIDENCRTLRAQVKSGGTCDSDGTVIINTCSNNWWKKTRTLYTRNECDVILAYDFLHDTVYMLTPDEFENRQQITIRTAEPIKNVRKNYNWARDFLLTRERLNCLFNSPVVQGQRPVT